MLPNVAALSPSLMSLMMQVYYSLNAVAGRVPFQFSVMSSMESAMSMVRWRCKTILGRDDGSLSEAMSRIQDLYTTFEICHYSTRNLRPYPDPSNLEEGMSIELRYVRSLLRRLPIA
jgi:hypothetical protein